MIGLIKSLQFFPHILTMKTRSTLIFCSHNVNNPYQKWSLPLQKISFVFLLFTDQIQFIRGSCIIIHAFLRVSTAVTSTTRATCHFLCM